MKPVFSLPLALGSTLGCAFSPAFAAPNQAPSPVTVVTVKTELTVLTVTSKAPVLISEVRSGGPRGGRDAFVELFNQTSKPLSLAGWSLRFGALKGGISNFQMVSGARIEARGHLLLVASDYSLKSVAAGDATFAASLRGGVALCDAKGKTIDAVGPSDSAPGLREGAGLPTFAFAPRATKIALKTAGEKAAVAGAADVPVAIPQFSCVRRALDGRPQDSGDNARDFVLVSVAGQLNGQKVQIGTPGPENAASQRLRALIASRATDLANGAATETATETVPALALAQTVALQTDPARNSMRRARRNVGPLRTFGTMTLRYRFTNDSPDIIKTMSFRVNSISNDVGTTLETPLAVPDSNLDAAHAQSADVRFVYGKDATLETEVTDAAAGMLEPQAPSPTGIDATIAAPQRPFFVWKAKLAGAPAQLLGGGLNALLKVDLPAGGIAPGARGEIRFDLGVERRGNYRIVLGNQRMNLVFEGNTEDDLVPATFSPDSGGNFRSQGAVSIARNGGAGTNSNGSAMAPDIEPNRAAPEEVAEGESLVLEGNTEDGVLLPPLPPSGGDS